MPTTGKVGAKEGATGGVVQLLIAALCARRKIFRVQESTAEHEEARVQPHSRYILHFIASAFQQV